MLPLRNGMGKKIARRDASSAVDTLFFIYDRDELRRCYDRPGVMIDDLTQHVAAAIAAGADKIWIGMGHITGEKREIFSPPVLYN